MDAINNKDTSSNHMQKYVEGNNGYISPITSSGYLNHINSKPVNDTETMDFTDIDVDSILAEEDPYADESNKISSKPIYGKTFGTEVKFTKGYNNVYDASSESNEINLNTNIVLDGNSRIKQVKAFDTNGTLVDLHIDINDDMNIDDIMQKVYESAAAMGITDDKIIIDISDQNGNSRAWVRAEDILLKDEIVSKTGDDIKIEESADDVINDLPHNISDADKLRNEVDNNQDTVSNTTNGFFSDIKNAVTKVAGSLSNAAIAKMEKANKTAKIHEEMSKVANDIIKNTIDNGTDYLKSFGNNIDKENLKINKDVANGVSFFENVGSKLQDIASENLANSIEAKKIKSQILSSSAEEMKSKLSSGLKNLSQVGANFNDVSKENFNLYKDFNNATEFLSSGAIAISDSFHGFIADSSKLLENANDWLVNDALPVIEDVSSTVSNALKRTGATVGTAALSLIEGVGKLGEAIVDAGATILIGAASIVTLVVDGGGYFYSDITGKKWNSVTEYMWDTTKAFVAKKHVANWFDSLYENSAAGKWLKTNAFFFNNVREVSSGIGYTVGIIGLTLATGGVGGIAGGTAGVAGIAGVGKGVEDAWGKGASTVGGLASGALNGLWEGFQFFVGAKINGINVFGKSAPTIKTKLINSLIHVALDGVDGGAEGFARTLIDTCYKDGYTDENGNYVKYTDADSILKKLQKNFDDLGGFNTVLTGAISGMATSAMSEALDLGKYFKDTSNERVDIFTEYANGEMLEKFKKEFLGYGGVDKSRIDAVKNTCEFLSAKDFKARGKSKNCMAYNNGVNSVINITSYSQEVTKLNIAHESCHQLSYYEIFDSDGNFLAYKCGLALQPSGSEEIRVGLNEATTELLAECIEGSEHANACGYMLGVSGLRDLLDLNIPGFSIENLKSAYFSHNFRVLNLLAISIDKVGGEGCFDRLVSAMDEASLKHNDTNLREIIDELALKLQISRK